MRVNLPIVIRTTTGMSKITFQKIIFPENKANNSTYRHQKQLKCWQWRNTAVAGRPPYRLWWRTAGGTQFTASVLFVDSAVTCVAGMGSTLILTTPQY